MNNFLLLPPNSLTLFLAHSSLVAIYTCSLTCSLRLLAYL